MVSTSLMRVLAPRAASQARRGLGLSGQGQRRCQGAAASGVADFRSDTVTKPCKRLRGAMARAEVGDDVFGEDPTVGKLEELVARLLGKEAALLVPSGTMGNLVAVGVHCRRGDEIILGERSHMFCYEGAGASAFLGVSYRPVRNAPDGGVDPADVLNAVRPDDPHCPRSSLLCLENTHNKCGGRAVPAARAAEAAAAARSAGLAVHVDGARLWNAAAALGVSPAALVRDADSATVCLSKALGAPAGSVLAGPAPFVREAKRLRKALGGGMRQAGVLAAAGLEAIVNNYPGLRGDHLRARALADGLGRLEGVRAPPAKEVETNIVYFQVEGPTSAGEVACRMREEHGVLVGCGYGERTLRMVTHRDVGDEEVSRALEAFAAVLGEKGVAGEM